MFSLFRKKSPAAQQDTSSPPNTAKAEDSPHGTESITTSPKDAQQKIHQGPSSSPSPEASPATAPGLHLTTQSTDSSLSPTEKLTKDLAEKVQELNDTKAATLNLLQDSLQLEQELKTERDRIKAIIASMGDGMVVIDKYYKILMINPVAERLLETTSMEATNENWNTIIRFYKGSRELLVDDRPATQCIITAEPVSIKIDDDIFFQTRSGNRYPVEMAATPLAGRGITGAVIVFRDISAEKESKSIIEQTVEVRTKQLKEEQARLEASINSLNLGFIMTDTKLNILTINSVAKRILYQAESSQTISAQNTRWMDFPFTMEYIDGQFKDSFKLIEHVQLHCLQDKKTVEFRDIPFRDLFLRVFLSPILMMRTDLEVIGTLIVVENITEAKVIERSKDEFFSIASHELRTPLTAIRGNTSLIKEFYASKLQDKDLSDMITDIHDSSIRLIQIVNDFLDLSRLEQKKIDFKNEPFRIEELCKEIIKEFQGQITEKHIALTLETHAQSPASSQAPHANQTGAITSPSAPTEAPLPMVFADRNRLKQVIMNLVGNAIKFTQEGGVHMIIEQSPTAIRVNVQDTGRGVSAKNQHLLFRKFQQAGESLITRDGAKGTGLGLYISKLLMEGMGGTIGLDKSDEGKGSTFYISIPMAKTHAQGSPKQQIGTPQLIQDLKQQSETLAGVPANQL